ncbi:MAG: ABC transporter permease [Dehalococcoidales bacterium]|nr:ABC transporter permease [Dehalococcoidales bacterium]
MRLNDIFSTAFTNLSRRKLRTVLTILAVVIGATLIGLLVSIGAGLQGFIVGQFGQMVPQNQITVSSTRTTFFDRQNTGPTEITKTETTVATPFTTADIARIKSISGVIRVDYVVNVNARYVKPEGSEKIYTIDPTAAPAYETRVRPLFAGNYYADDATGQALIAYNYLKAFGWKQDASAIGKKITITVGKSNAYNRETQDFTFTIVGVIDPTVSNAEVLIPVNDGIQMARYYQSNDSLYSDAQPGFALKVEATDKTQVDAVAKAITDLGFGAITPLQILDRINSIFSVIKIALSAFGIIALVVASIGIINTLLMAVHERTKEIGIMKAVGATKNNIRLLFTLEGGALGFAGGVIGCLIAFLLGQALNFIGARTFLSSFPGFKLSAFQVWLAPAVIALTTAVALLAGLYPANQAAKLDPVESLRYE